MKKIFDIFLTIIIGIILSLIFIMVIITGAIVELYGDIIRALKNKRNQMKTSQRIQLKKTITWTVISFFVTTGIGWAVTGNIFIGLTVGAADRVIKMILYYWHERYWHKKYKAAKKAKKIGD